MKFYHPFAKLCILVYRIFHPGWKATREEALEGPVVYLIHHQNMRGPIHFMGLMPGQAHLWVLHVFMTRKKCFDQFYRYTFTTRFHWPKPVAFLVAGFLSLIIPPFIRGLGAIPVYHGTAVFSTMKESIAALERGESIVLCPDVNYSDSHEEIGEIYRGFLGLERMYSKKTGKHLPFVFVHCSRKRRIIVAGHPVYFKGEKGFRDELEGVAGKLVASMAELGRQCGDIVPAPEVTETITGVTILSPPGEAHSQAKH